ncbi:MAG: molybdopterin-synthase adenylyltransferase MoeB [Opitutales bacterium]|nr:molybdopterin-synthase adenylyltransferase MoeB [Opitutales bacterium]MCH8539512.1 molybdopterin-synthase adenylyltransferase MoeB [Opitutales bacterium]
MSEPHLTEAEITRYSRQTILPGVGLEGQVKLKNSRVLVIGAGGLGSPVLLYLAAGGIGTLGIADPDTVTTHNLQRQIIHDTPSEGERKVTVARRKIEALNPHTKTIEHPTGITPENALGIFSEYDLIIDATDNFPTRFLNNDAAYLARKPLVSGSILRYEGQFALFDPNRSGPCYRCLFPRMPEPGTVPNCAEAGVLGALAGIIGSAQAFLAIRYLLGIGDAALGQLTVYRGTENQFRTLQLKKDPHCPLCSKKPEIMEIDPQNYQWQCSSETSDGDEPPLEISVQEAAERLRTAPENHFLLDVREPDEWNLVRIPEAQLIPMGNVAGQTDALPKEKTILVHCHHGMRSLRVTQFLRQKGFPKVTNIAGGIDAWAREVDPSLKRY